MVFSNEGHSLLLLTRSPESTSVERLMFPLTSLRGCGLQRQDGVALRVLRTPFTIRSAIIGVLRPAFSSPGTSALPADSAGRMLASWRPVEANFQLCGHPALQRKMAALGAAL